MPQTVAYTNGGDAATLCAAYWFEPDPWQRDILDTLLSRDEYGRLSAVTAGISVPRQNGKNGAVECLEFYLLLTDGNTHILHTAHQVKTAKKAFDRLARAFTQNRDPEIRAMVDRVRNTNGQEGIFLKNGASIEYVARSRGSGRGFDNITLIVYDEAQELQTVHVEALMFTLGASKGDRQIIYMGTPPSPDTAADVFRLRRKKFMESPTPRSCYFEWGITSPPRRGSTFDDLIDVIYDTNPAMGVRLDEDFTREEFDNTTLEGFARERLGWWQEAGVATSPISATKWAQLANPKPPIEGKTCFAAKFSPDGSVGVLCACIKPEDGPAHVEIVADGIRSMEYGTSWFADFLVRVAPTTSLAVIDGKSNAKPLYERLLAAVDEDDEPLVPRRAIHLCDTGNVADACAMFVDAVREGQVTHFDQPALNESVTGCCKRLIGNTGGYGFGPGTTGADPTAAEAAALAYWACMTTKRDASREGECG
jgi:hypothetical protein